MAQLSGNMRGAILMAGGMTCFTVNDAFMKILTQEMALFQALLLRGIGATLVLILIAWALGQLMIRASRRDWLLMSVRSVTEMASAWLFITALAHMPFANLSAILQSLPLTVTLAGALFLGEAVGWRRLAAILLGFVGVLMIVQPGNEAFTIYSVYGLATVACVTVRDIVSRTVSAKVPSMLVATVSSLGVTLFAAVGSGFVAWTPLETQHLWLLGGAVIFIFGGYLCSVGAMRTGEIGFVAPFRYTSLVAALIVGAVVFGTFPDALTLAGAALVVATGLFTLYREQVARRAAARATGRKPG